MIKTIIVTSEEYQQRLDLCRTCEHFTAMGTCGPVGRKTKTEATIKKRKGKVELCGCFMAVKCKLKFARCPIQRWNQAEATKEELTFHKKAAKFAKGVKGKTSLTSEEIKELYSYHNHTHGSKQKASGCAPCIKTAMNDLEKWVNDYA